VEVGKGSDVVVEESGNREFFRFQCQSGVGRKGGTAYGTQANGV
jgi:hypothetical protein